MYINLFSRGGLLPLNVETTLGRRRHLSTANRMELFPRLNLDKLMSYNLPVIGGSAGIGLGNSIGDDPGVGGNPLSTDTQIIVESTSVIDGLTMSMTTVADTATAQSVSTTLPPPVSGNTYGDTSLTTSSSKPAPTLVSTHSASTMSSASSRVPRPSVQVQSSAAADTAGGTQSKSLPGAAIAGIVFGVLFFALAVGVLAFRARSIRRRSMKRKTWVSKPFMVSTTRTVLTDRPIEDGIVAAASNPGATAGIGGTNSVAAIPAPRTNLKIPRVKPPPLSLLSVPGLESAGLDSGSSSNYFGASHRLSAVTTSSADSTTSSLMVQTNSAPPTIGATYGALTNVGVVRCIFEPRLPDELRIRVGDAMRVLAEYDDGWGLCESARGERGMVPLQCLDRGMEDDDRVGLARPASERLSMLGVTGRTMRQSSLPALV